jgi:hypothetical protein
LRKAINENPVVQIAVLGGMAIVVGFLLFTRVLSSGSSEEAAAPTDSATPPAAESGAAPTEAPVTGSAPAPTTTPPATGTAPPATGAVPPATEAVPSAPAPSTVDGEFSAGPGLPKPVVSAYDDGKAIALFIEKRKGIDDKALVDSVEQLRSRNDLALFLVPAKEVSRYARITEGVDIDRVPALVTVSPRSVSGRVPEATVSYGFRGPDSVRQAVEDALFDGKTVTYDP